jgi:uncharacterized membrane protein (DUF2068 family)
LHFLSGPNLPVHLCKTGQFSIANRGNSGIVYDRRDISWRYQLLKDKGLKERKGRSQSGSRGCHRHDDTGLHIVALFEAAKGAVVILAGLGLLALIHRDVQAVAESFVRHIHLNPARHFPHIFLDAAARATDARLWAMALTAMLYAAIRFAEAYGLWRKQLWAEWFGILSGALYLPVEIYELTLSVSVVKMCILLVNLIVVGWLSCVRWQAKHGL